MLASRLFGPLLGSAPGQVWLKASAALLPEGPTDAERRASHMVVVAEAREPSGQRVVSRLRTPEAFSFSGMSAAAIAERVLEGDLEPGFQTPARVYGANFVLSLPAVSREDL
jgi:short subunit dehydrogenase-like uncharacterized protein